MNPVERFWSRVDVRGPDECWLWTSGTWKGYGKVYRDGKRIPAHKFSYELENGEVPDGLHVLHHCDNPSCVNPSHLFAGTHKDNMHDMIAKGRSPVIGTSHSGYWRRRKDTKLTPELVQQIRESPDSGSTWARRLGISVSTACRVKRGTMWTPEVIAGYKASQEPKAAAAEA